MTDKLLAVLDKERQAPDKGLGARLLRAAKMYAFMKEWALPVFISEDTILNMNRLNIL